MEAQIKEETSDACLCVVDVDSPEQDLRELSIVEKYDRFLQNDESEPDSDGEFFPDESVLKREYAQLRKDVTQCSPDHKRNRLSTGLPTLNRRSSSLDAAKPGSIAVTELIDKLNAVRRCEPDGNSIFCTESDLREIQERYAEILDHIYEKSSTFERVKETEEIDTGTEEGISGRDDNLKPLAEKMESVRSARDKYNEVEQQVREYIEQLELVERYKMESVG